MTTTIFHHHVTGVTISEALLLETGGYCRDVVITDEDGGELTIHLFSENGEATLPAFEIIMTEAAA